MARGNQRDKAREANLKKQAAQVRPFRLETHTQEQLSVAARPMLVAGGLRTLSCSAYLSPQITKALLTLYLCDF